jgi:hypothetical protein
MTKFDKIKEIVANECSKCSTCFDKNGKEVDCINDCDFVKNIAKRVINLK